MTGEERTDYRDDSFRDAARKTFTGRISLLQVLRLRRGRVANRPTCGRSLLMQRFAKLF